MEESESDRGGFKAKPTVAECSQCVTLEPRKPPEGFVSHAMGRLPEGQFHGFIWRYGETDKSKAVSSDLSRGNTRDPAETETETATETKRQRSDGVIGPPSPNPCRQDRSARQPALN